MLFRSYYPQKIEKQIAFLNSLPADTDLSKVVLHTATESIDRDGKVIKTPSYKDLPIKEDTLQTIIGNVHNYRLSGCSFLLPNSCYQNMGGFREDIRTVSDVEYWYRLLFGGYQFYCLKNDILVQNRSHGKQVGKVRVSLFDQELDQLHIAIADQLAEQAKPSDMERFYCGLVKRGIVNAARYTRETYLKRQLSNLEYNFILPVKIGYYKAFGMVRLQLRNLYRRINVK